MHATLLPDGDPDASRAFYCDTLGFEVRNEVAYSGTRSITVGRADMAGRSSSGLRVCL
jgi:catechol 2,3-dioxygenase-like lactoylglutathione lyase family enzyme